MQPSLQRTLSVLPFRFSHWSSFIMKMVCETLSTFCLAVNSRYILFVLQCGLLRVLWIHRSNRISAEQWLEERHKAGCRILSLVYYSIIYIDGVISTKTRMNLFPCLNLVSVRTLGLNSTSWSIQLISFQLRSDVKCNIRHLHYVRGWRGRGLQIISVITQSPSYNMLFG